MRKPNIWYISCVEDTPEPAGPYGFGRRNYRKLIVLFLVVLLAGGGAGVGMNFALKKPAAKTAADTGRAETERSAKTKAEREKGLSATPSPPGFTTSQAMGHIFTLSEQAGERRAGSVKESAAADYIVSRLGEYGYMVEEQPFTMPDGFGSRNIIGTRRGSSDPYTIVIAAHYDSAPGSRGAVDDASGVGVVLELARVFSQATVEPTLQFVFFGGNRPGSSDTDSRLVGARTFVDLLGTMQRKDVIGMIELDCVGQGETLALRTQGTGLQRLRDKLDTYASEKNVSVTSLKSSEDSDNIPFENSGVPAVWVEWCDQGGSVSTDNRYASVMAGKVETAGTLVEGFVNSLTTEDMEELKY